MENDEKKTGPADSDKSKGQKRLHIKAADEIAKGVYTNVAFAHHTENEFVLDFVFVEPGRPQGHVVSRVITNPKAAKKLAMALSGLVKRYEERFGEIEVPEPSSSSNPQGNYH